MAGMSFSTLVVGLGRVGMGEDPHLDSGGHALTHARAFNCANCDKHLYQTVRKPAQSPLPRRSEEAYGEPGPG